MSYKTSDNRRIVKTILTISSIVLSKLGNLKLVSELDKVLGLDYHAATTTGNSSIVGE